MGVVKGTLVATDRRPSSKPPGLGSSLNAHERPGAELNVHADEDGSAQHNIALHKVVMENLAENDDKVPEGL